MRRIKRWWKWMRLMYFDGRSKSGGGGRMERVGPGFSREATNVRERIRLYKREDVLSI